VSGREAHLQLPRLRADAYANQEKTVKTGTVAAEGILLLLKELRGPLLPNV
jgi:hypothetical protein